MDTKHKPGQLQALWPDKNLLPSPTEREGKPESVTSLLHLEFGLIFSPTQQQLEHHVPRDRERWQGDIAVIFYLLKDAMQKPSSPLTAPQSGGQ